MLKATFEQPFTNQDLLLLQLRSERLQIIILEALESYTFLNKFAQEQRIEAYGEFHQQLKVLLEALQSKTKEVKGTIQEIQKRGNIFLQKILPSIWSECEAIVASIKQLQVDHYSVVASLLYQEEDSTAWTCMQRAVRPRVSRHSYAK